MEITNTLIHAFDDAEKWCRHYKKRYPQLKKEQVEDAVLDKLNEISEIKINTLRHKIVLTRKECWEKEQEILRWIYLENKK